MWRDERVCRLLGGVAFVMTRGRVMKRGHIVKSSFAANELCRTFSVTDARGRISAPQPLSCPFNCSQLAGPAAFTVAVLAAKGCRGVNLSPLSVGLTLQDRVGGRLKLASAPELGQFNQKDIAH